MPQKKKPPDGTEIEIKSNILENLCIYIYVTDLATNEILFANNVIQHTHEGNDLLGKTCWAALRNKNKRCDLCPIPYLLKNPGKSFQWKYTEGERCYQIHDSIIPWSKGRLAHLQYMVEIAD